MSAEALTPTEKRAMAILIKHGPTSCAMLGDTLWGRKRAGSNCSCPYARPAGKVVKSLIAKGLVERDVSFTDRWYYAATRKGLGEIES